MSITYTKNIISLGCYSQINGESNVVFKIMWSLCGEDGVFTNIIPCSCEVPYVAGQPFTKFSDLTEDQVIGWIEEYSTEEQMNLWINAIADSIETQKQVQNQAPPWTPALS